MESTSEYHTASLPSTSNTRNTLFTVAVAQASVAVNPALYMQKKSVPSAKTDSRTRNSRTHNSSSRTTLLFVAITFILVLSWIPYWFTIFADTYVGLVVGRIFYVNNCTNFLVFAMNPTLRQEMAQVIKRLICCRIARA